MTLQKKCKRYPLASWFKIIGQWVLQDSRNLWRAHSVALINYSDQDKCGYICKGHSNLLDHLTFSCNTREHRIINCRRTKGQVCLLWLMRISITLSVTLTGNGHSSLAYLHHLTNNNCIVRLIGQNQYLLLQNKTCSKIKCELVYCYNNCDNNF